MSRVAWPAAVAALLVACVYGPSNAPTTGDLAGDLEEAGRFSEALALYRQALSEGEDGPFIHIGMGRCLEEVGQLDDALASYDLAIGDGGWYPPFVARMSCMERTEGVDAAIRWLERQPVPGPDTHQFHHIVGDFHWEAQRIDDVIASYEDSARLACEKHDFRFDANEWVIRDEATLRRTNNELCSTWPTFDDLARLTCSRGDKAAAMRWATRAVSMGQLIVASLGHYPPACVECGSVDGRLVRAHLLMDGGRYAPARAEIEHARARADFGNFQGWKDKVNAARERLAALEEL